MTVAAQAGVFEALGALAFAARGRLAAGGAARAERADWTGAPAFPADPRILVRPSRSRIGRLPPAKDGPGAVIRLEDTLVWVKLA